ncbi:acetyl-CoA synthetase-like protein [Mollisia scopiformis]|uniref:Acetyl-CoA synthetase-like protein n=1 Tax=Mollisia scopiformis TaxID=149040 RepID=A0A194XMA5_MOLSC|nr:acetyl-CoA synthetase-like protein [Mollisia scopiformis]KUJ20902.1 acetyl-CoA synthetase-like protein [Mollisia scopiformis]
MAVASPFPPVDIPEIDTWTFLFEGKREFTDNQVIFLDAKTFRQYSFHELKQTAIAFGHALRTQWNWKKNDCIGVYSPNCVDTPAVIFGAIWAGAIVSPANPAYSASELAFQLKDSGAKALITQGSCLEVAFEAAKIVNIPRNRILVIGDEKTAPVQHFSQFVLTANDSPPLSRVPSTPSEVVFLVYSSGTTGLPKGVMLSHRNIIVNLLQTDPIQTDLSHDGGVDGKGDAVIAVLPFYHLYGLQYEVLYMVHLGVKAVILAAFQPDAFCQAVQDHKCTFGYLVPPILLFLGKSPLVDKYDLSSLKTAYSAAAPLTSDLVEGVWNRLQLRTKQAYGLSETSPAITTMETKDWRRKMGSVGPVLPNQIVKVMSDDEKLLPAFSDGEIWVQGPNVFPGYLNNPTATANCMTSDGFFKTGDIGHFDNDGFLYITDRKKELIKYKGFQVAPAELEGLLIGHEKIADACVLGVYEKSQATELPRAYLVKAESAKSIDDTILAKEIQEWLGAKVAPHKRLRGGIYFVDAIPKSAAGKILRRILRDQVKATEGRIEGPKSKL